MTLFSLCILIRFNLLFYFLFLPPSFVRQSRAPMRFLPIPVSLQIRTLYEAYGTEKITQKKQSKLSTEATLQKLEKDECPEVKKQSYSGI